MLSRFMKCKALCPVVKMYNFTYCIPSGQILVLFSFEKKKWEAFSFVYMPQSQT